MDNESLAHTHALKKNILTLVDSIKALPFNIIDDAAEDAHPLVQEVRTAHVVGVDSVTHTGRAKHKTARPQRPAYVRVRRATN